jgi:hypothetical protein
MSVSALAKRASMAVPQPRAAQRQSSNSTPDEQRIMPLGGLTPAGHAFHRVNVFPAPTARSDADTPLADSGAAGAQSPRTAPNTSPPAAPAGPAAPAAPAVPTLTVADPSYTDSGSTSTKTVVFNVAVPSGLTATDYALVNKLQGSLRKADGSFYSVRMYGSVVPFNFTTEQVDSVDADPVYASTATSRWNYSTTAGGFSSNDTPGRVNGVYSPGDVAAVRFKIGLYRMADLPATTTGTIAANPLSEVPWQFSVVCDATTGAISHPAL